MAYGQQVTWRGFAKDLECKAQDIVKQGQDMIVYMHGAISQGVNTVSVD